MYVPVGGISQWITIKGDDRNNPVLLFLHGGPGDAWSPVADSWFRGWEKSFTLVQWDQRGAGRTYTKNGPSILPTMTTKRITQDGIEVTEFLTRHLHKKKIVILGGSWGSILGIHMAQERPDLFYAYVGCAQIVNEWDDVSAAYTRIDSMAHRSDDQQAITALKTIGPPPWHSVSEWHIYRKWERIYQAKVATAPEVPGEINPAYASPQERTQYAEADDFSAIPFFGATLSGELFRVNLPALGTIFAIPIFMIQGQEDLTAVPEVSKAYFDSIQAPSKHFYLVAGTGHELSVPQAALTLKVLTDEVRPLTKGDMR